MIIDYLRENFKNGDPIFISDIKGYSNDYVRFEFKRLVDEGKLMRFSNGIYYLPYTTILGTPGKISVEDIAKRKYMKNSDGVIGYYSGIKLANRYGFTTQNPACIEIVSNCATTKMRKLNINSRDIIVYKPTIEITNDNVNELQFLELMKDIDQISEIQGKELNNKLKRFVKETNVNFNVVKELINLFPDKVFKNIYNAGLINKLI